MPTTIINGFLYLGSYDTASRQDLLKAMGITHVLNVSRRSVLTSCMFFQGVLLLKHLNLPMALTNVCRCVKQQLLLNLSWCCLLILCRLCPLAQPCTRTPSTITLWKARSLTLRTASSSLVRPQAPFTNSAAHSSCAVIHDERACVHTICMAALPS
jgi:hypothetical protein